MASTSLTMIGLALYAIAIPHLYVSPPQAPTYGLF
jgi:hypothetical protein